MEASRNRAPQRSARIVLATLMLVAAAQAPAATDRERGRERAPGRSPAAAASTAAAAPRPVKLLKLDEINEPTAAGPAAPAGSHRRAGVLALATGGLAFVAVAWVRRPRRPAEPR